MSANPPTNLTNVQFSEPLQLPDGTAAAPGGTFTNDLDTGLYRVGANSIGVAAGGAQVTQIDANGIATLGDMRMGSATAGAAQSTRRANKLVTAIADNTATDILTVTVPNATAAARLRVTVVTYLGAGGAVGAGEATAVYSRDFAINRFLGANVVVGTATATGSTSALSSGAATNTTTLAASSITGAVGATNTFTVQVTIAKGSGSSANHVCMVDYEIVNVITGGVTVA